MKLILKIYSVSRSSKVGIYDNEQLIIIKSLEHPVNKTRKYEHI